MTFAKFLFVSAPEIIRVGGWCYVVAAMMRLMPDVLDFLLRKNAEKEVYDVCLQAMLQVVRLRLRRVVSQKEWS